MSSVVRGRGSLTPTVAGGSVRGLPGSDCGCGVSIWAVAGVSGEQQKGGGPSRASATAFPRRGTRSTLRRPDSPFSYRF